MNVLLLNVISVLRKSNSELYYKDDELVMKIINGGNQGDGIANQGVIILQVPHILYV